MIIIKRNTPKQSIYAIILSHLWHAKGMSILYFYKKKKQMSPYETIETFFFFPLRYKATQPPNWTRLDLTGVKYNFLNKISLWHCNCWHCNQPWLDFTKNADYRKVRCDLDWKIYLNIPINIFELIMVIFV